MEGSKSTPVKSASIRLDSGMSIFQTTPQVKGTLPAVILLHERYGLVQHTNDLVVKFAHAGYVALAPDLFWRFDGDKEGLAQGSVRVRLRDNEVLQDLGEALDRLKGLEFVDPARIAVMGVCATGRHSVLFQAHNRDVRAAVVFYGAVGGEGWSVDECRQEPLEHLIQKLSAPVLGVFGEADHSISLDAVAKFRTCLEQHRKSYHIKLYPDAPHGWLNDTMPGRYREDAARDAWQLLLGFLKKAFGHDPPQQRILWNWDVNFSPNYDFSKNVRYE